MKLMTVVGARPQFIKASALSRAIAAADDFDEVLVHTGQHYDDNMSDVFFRELGLTPPQHALGIGGGSHGAMTGAMLGALEGLMLELKPDAVVIYGDTNSTLAGALAAAKLHIPVAHIEAGLRSFNRLMPEEINRVMSDHISNWLLCPTDGAVGHLAAEGIHVNVFNVGDIMYDVALHTGAVARTKSNILARYDFQAGQYVLATIHRQENTSDPLRLRNIFQALNKVGEQLPVILPLHPRTRQCLETSGIVAGAGLKLIDPVGYLDMSCLEQNAALVATDSGGVQKEAFFYQIPCVTLRDETEWVELVESGWNTLADVHEAGLADVICSQIGKRGAEGVSFYGQGNTSDLILDALRQG